MIPALVRRGLSAVAILTLVAALATCTPAHVPISPGAREEFDGQGALHGKFFLGNRPLKHGWVEMIQLDGPPEERCGPGDCGAEISALRPLLYSWSPGRWRVKPPAVKGWIGPDPIVIQVTADEVTRFTLIYERKRAKRNE